MPLPSLCSDFELFFILPAEKLKAIVRRFRDEMEQGLDHYGEDMAMVPSYVTGVPDGSEEGLASNPSA